MVTEEQIRFFSSQWDTWIGTDMKIDKAPPFVPYLTPNPTSPPRPEQVTDDPPRARCHTSVQRLVGMDLIFSNDRLCYFPGSQLSLPAGRGSEPGA